MPRPRFTPQERPGTHCTGGWVGTRAGLDRCGISCSTAPGFDPQTVQPVVSRYTNWAIWPILKETAEKKNTESTVVSSNDENSYDLDGIGRVPQIWAKWVETTEVSLHPSFPLGCHLFSVQLKTSLKSSQCTAIHRTLHTMIELTRIHKTQLHFSHIFLTAVGLYWLLVIIYTGVMISP